MNEVVAAGSAIATAIFLAIVNMKIVEYVFIPIKKKFPQVDFWWVIYVALVTGFIIGWIAEVNLFGAYIPNETLGRIISSILVGGGSSLIYDIFDPK